MSAHWIWLGAPAFLAGIFCSTLASALVKAANKIIRRYAPFRELLLFGCPLLIGVSRKTIFRDLPDGLIEGRLVGTLAANVFAASLGARVFRVHDALEHRTAFAVMAAMKPR